MSPQAEPKMNWRHFDFTTQNMAAIAAAVRHCQFMNKPAAFGGEQSAFNAMLMRPDITSGELFVKACGNSDDNLRVQTEGGGDIVVLMTPCCTCAIERKSDRWTVRVSGYENPAYAAAMLTKVAEQQPTLEPRLPGKAGKNMHRVPIDEAIKRYKAA